MSNICNILIYFFHVVQPQLSSMKEKLCLWPRGLELTVSKLGQTFQSSHGSLPIWSPYRLSHSSYCRMRLGYKNEAFKSGSQMKRNSLVVFMWKQKDYCISWKSFFFHHCWLSLKRLLYTTSVHFQLNFYIFLFYFCVLCNAHVQSPCVFEHKSAMCFT